MTTPPERRTHDRTARSCFKGSFLHALRDTVRLPDGSSATREYVVHPGAVMVIPLLDDGRAGAGAPVPLSDGPGDDRIPGRQARCRRGSAGLRAARAAGGDRLQRPRMGARRRACTRRSPTRPNSSTSSSRAGLTLQRAQLDDGEFLDVITATPEELLGWCRDGTVTDAKTLTVRAVAAERPFGRMGTRLASRDPIDAG